jgi:hypothetical protein
MDFYFALKSQDELISSFKGFLETLIKHFQSFENIFHHYIDHISPFLYHYDFQNQIKNRENLSQFDLIIFYSEIFIFYQDKIVEFLYRNVKNNFLIL